jgi:hypothetical protein
MVRLSTVKPPSVLDPCGSQIASRSMSGPSLPPNYRGESCVCSSAARASNWACSAGEAFWKRLMSTCPSCRIAVACCGLTAVGCVWRKRLTARSHLYRNRRADHPSAAVWPGLSRNGPECYYRDARDPRGSQGRGRHSDEDLARPHQGSGPPGGSGRRAGSGAGLRF